MYLYKNRFSVSWKKKSKTSLLGGVKEIEKNFRYEEAQKNNNIIKQVVEYNFPISNDKNFLYNVFVFALETCNVEYSEHCEAYGAGAYHRKNLFEYFIGD